MNERRRTARRAPGREASSLHTMLDVRVVDISPAGVLLHCNRSLQLGARARLRLNLDGAPFAADVVIRRVRTGIDGTAGFDLGAEFTGLTPDARRLIETFISGQ